MDKIIYYEKSWRYRFIIAVQARRASLAWIICFLFQTTLLGAAHHLSNPSSLRLDTSYGRLFPLPAVVTGHRGLFAGWRIERGDNISLLVAIQIDHAHLLSGLAVNQGGVCSIPKVAVGPCDHVSD